MQSVSFEYPQAFFLFIPLSIVYFFLFKKRLHGSLVFSSLNTFSKIPQKKVHPRFILHSLRIIGLSLLIISLARPQIIHPNTLQRKGIDIILAIDTSSSMLALDFSKNGPIYTRFEAVKSVLEDFIKKRPNDAIGLIAFAGNPYLVSPLTLNHNWLIQNLQRLQVGMIEDGTAIGSALTSAISRLQNKQTNTPIKRKQIIILLTDGFNNKGSIDPQTAAEIAAKLHIKIYTIGVGQGGIVPTLYLNSKGQIAKNASGQAQVVQAEIPVDNETLENIAKLSAGKHFQAKDKKQLELIYQSIDGLEKHILNEKSRTVLHELFLIPLLIALSLLLLEHILSHTRLQILP